MSWNAAGRAIDCCSCNLVCPCSFGPAEPDRGWCSGSITFDIQEGSSDGVSLAGTRVIWAIDMPTDIVSGNGTARLYIDDTATTEQRRELEAILMGKKGGPWETVAGLITKWLPTRSLPISIRMDGKVEVKAGDVGRVQLEPVVTAGGDAVKIINPPGFAVFGIGEVHCAYSSGSGWNDSDMRRWESAPHGWGSLSRFSWSA